MSKLPRTRKEARETGSNKYFTGKRCVNDHLSERYTINSACIECRREYDKRRGPDHYQHTAKWKEYQREYHKKYRLTDRGAAIKAAAGERWREKQKIKKILKEHGNDD